MTYFCFASFLVEGAFFRHPVPVFMRISAHPLAPRQTLPYVKNEHVPIEADTADCVHVVCVLDIFGKFSVRAVSFFFWCFYRKKRDRPQNRLAALLPQGFLDYTYCMKMHE